MTLEATQPRLGPHTRRPRRIWLGAVAVLVALLLVAGGWSWSASLARGNVAVSWSQPVQCTGTTIREEQLGFGAGRARVIPMVKTMNCLVRLKVVNTGRTSVRVNSSTLPLMGADGGSGARVDPAGAAATATGSARDLEEIDSVLAIDKILGPGETLEVDTHLVFRPSGCNSPRSLMWVEGLPQVSVSALWMPGQVHGDETLALRGTPDTSCDR